MGTVLCTAEIQKFSLPIGTALRTATVQDASIMVHSHLPLG